MAKKDAQSTSIHPVLVVDDDVGTPPHPVTSIEKLQDDESNNSAPATYSGDVEGIYVIGMSPEELDFNATFNPKMRAAMNRKVDIRLIPVLATMFFISHLDRGNIGNAYIEGMADDLNLTGVQVSLSFTPSLGLV